MTNQTTTVYANVVNMRLTPGEMVLEFGVHFPDRPQQGPPSDYRPDVRVVLPPGALPGLQRALTQALQQLQQNRPAAPAKPTPGFPASQEEKDNES